MCVSLFCDGSPPRGCDGQRGVANKFISNFLSMCFCRFEQLNLIARCGCCALKLINLRGRVTETLSNLIREV